MDRAYFFLAHPRDGLKNLEAKSAPQTPPSNALWSSSDAQMRIVGALADVTAQHGHPDGSATN